MHNNYIINIEYLKLGLCSGACLGLTQSQLVSLQPCIGLTSSQSKHALQSVLPSSGLVHPCTIFWLGFNIALRFYVSHIQRTQMICNDANAMQLKERHDWAIIYRASTAYTLKRQTGLVLQHKSSFKNFSLKCFLLKSITSLLRKS